jgi:predicted Zn-dependent protease
MRHPFTLTLTALLLAAPALAQQTNSNIDNIGNRDLNKGGLSSRRLPDLGTEIAIGRQASRELEQKVKLFTDPGVVGYVNQVGQKIVDYSDVKIPVTFRVIDSAVINATALPGGYVYVNTGLIMSADNEAELAGMLGHAVAHIAARHAMERSQMTLMTNFATPTIVSGGGIPGMVTEQAAAIGVQPRLVHFSREAEKEADWLALQYMYQAGYDPNAMVSFFMKVRSQETVQQNESSLFQTHPKTEERIRSTEQNIQKFLPARAQYIVTTSDFRAAKARLTELTVR